MNFFLAIVLKAFFVFAFFIACATLRVSVQKWFPNGSVKRLLLSSDEDLRLYLLRKKADFRRWKNASKSATE